MFTHQLPFGTLGLKPLHPACRLIVTIPAKDEADFITLTLDALRRQKDAVGQALNPNLYEVIVLANNCTDATAAICSAYTRRYPAFRLHVIERRLPATIACVGTVRRLMMDTAMLRFRELGRKSGVICTTDADTRVSPRWVHHTLRTVENGARAVGGRILVPASDRATDPRYRKYHLQDVTYRSLQYCLESMIDPCAEDPWPRHFQHFGPSTALTAEAYERCGGIPPLTSLEDVHLVRALERAGIPVTHNRKVKVYTSSRVSHRVEGTAFSHQLDEWAEMTTLGHSQRVVGLRNCRRMFKWKVALRCAVQRGEHLNPRTERELATALGWSTDRLRDRLTETTEFGTLYQKIRIHLEACDRFANTEIDLAISELRAFTSSLRHRAFGTGPIGSVPPGRNVVA